MKKFYIYLYSLLILFSLPLQSAEEGEHDQALQNFEKLIMGILPLEPYDEQQERVKDEKGLHSFQENKQENCPFFTLPIEVLSDGIVPYLDLNTHPAVKLVCQSLYALLTLESPFLNDYCLQETRVLNIPKPILLRKTRNIIGGIFLVAARMCVTPAHLTDWYEMDFLNESFTSCNSQIPPQLDTQDDRVLGKLYPIMKIALALPEAKDKVGELLAPILEIYQSGNANSLSFNQLCLLSLMPSPDLLGYYCPALEGIICGYDSNRFRCSPNLVHFIKRELLMKGRVSSRSIASMNMNQRELLMKGGDSSRSIASMNHTFFVSDPQQKQTAIQIMEWCVDNLSSCENNDYRLLAQDTLLVERNDLTERVFRDLMKLKARSNLDCLGYQASVFNTVKEQVKGLALQPVIKEFAHNISSNWNQLCGDAKLDALSLMFWAQEREDIRRAVDNLLSDHYEGTLNYCPSCLFKKLLDNNYLEEADKVKEFCAYWNTSWEICEHSASPQP